MSTNKRYSRPPAKVAKKPEQAKQAQRSKGEGSASKALTSRLSFDALINEYTRSGVGDFIGDYNNYGANNVTENYALLNSLYRSDWIACRIVDMIPEDMTKNWYKLTSAVDPKYIKDYENVERKAHVPERILEGLKWGRLYGGAAGVILIEGQEDILDQPLDLDSIMPGSFKGIIIADRWNGVYPSLEMVTDISDPDFGLPEFYRFSVDEKSIEGSTVVHHSRVIRFTGRMMPYFEREQEMFWGVSEIEHVYEELNKRNTTSANIAQLIFQAHLRVLKMENLGQDLAFGDPAMASDLYNTLQAQNKLMNNMSLQVMSKDDDFQTFQYTFSGLSDVYELFMNDIAGACEIPSTKLFGRSPAGMNATGESDLTNYYDSIRKWQEAQLRPILEKLMPIIAISAWGAVPDDIGFEFNPVRDTSDEERANLIQQTSGAVNSVFQSGIISQKIALKELKDSGATYGMWSNITDEDIENADDSMQPQDGGMGGGMPGEMPGGMPGMGDMGGAMPGGEEGANAEAEGNMQNSASEAPQGSAKEITVEEPNAPQNANLMAKNANEQGQDGFAEKVAGVALGMKLINVLKRALGKK